MTVVRPAEPPRTPVFPLHEHLWELRETEYDDRGFTVNRFECTCGEVSYA